jgi:predicted glycoside hydrolase/deacetylase ChbG (UPF0249 family)
MEQKRVTSATLMMNGPALEDALGRIGKYPQCSFGVHLNLTQFAPVSSHPGLLPLLNDKGEFTGVGLPNPRNIPLTSAIRDGVYAEWSAQIQRALDLGVPISHLDSHHHVHTRASLLGVLKRILNKFSIRKVRLRRNVSGISRPMRWPRRLRNFSWNSAVRKYAGATTTDGFAAFSTFHERLQAGAGYPGTIELMCHPGRNSYALETTLLEGDWQERLDRDTQLISYNELR